MQLLVYHIVRLDGQTGDNDSLRITVQFCEKAYDVAVGAGETDYRASDNDAAGFTFIALIGDRLWRHRRQLIEVAAGLMQNRLKVQVQFGGLL